MTPEIETKINEYLADETKLYQDSSSKNIRRLKKLAVSENEEVSKLAKIVLEVAKVKPYKKRRLKVLGKSEETFLNRNRAYLCTWLLRGIYDGC